MKIVIEVSGPHEKAILNAWTDWMHQGGFEQFQVNSPYPLEQFISFPRDEEIAVMIQERSPSDQSC